MTRKANLSRARIFAGISSTVLGPFAINYNDVGFAEPATNGIPTLTVPAGVLVSCQAIYTSPWDSGFLQLQLGDAGAPNDSMLWLAGFRLPSGGGSNPTYAKAGLSPGDPGTASVHSQMEDMPRWVLTVQESTIFAAAFAASPPFTKGAVELYAICLGI